MAEKEEIPVLILDDERLVRLTLTAWLRPTKFKPTVVGTAAEAMEAMKQSRFQAIVSDVMMEGMGGFMFRDYVRTVDRHVPVIFLTALVNDADNSFMRKVMADLNSYYVPKTAPKEYLIGKLDQVVSAYIAETSVARMKEHLDKSLDLANIVQRSMLPPWTRDAGRYFYSAFLQPLDRVGGDVFHYCPIGKDAALLILGDISGHGISSALAMTAIQVYFSHFSTLSDREARNVVGLAREIDAFILEHLKNVAYMPATIIYYDSATNLIRYLNAGNPEPLAFRRGDGSEIALNPDRRGATPLGFIPTGAFTDDDVVEMTLPDDALVVVGTDGVVDLTADEAGEEHIDDATIKDVLSALVADDRDCVSAMPQRLLATLDSLGYDHHQDDMTVMIFGRKRPQEMARNFAVPMNPAAIDEVVQQCGEFVREKKPECAEVSVKIEMLLNEHLMNVHDHAMDEFSRRHEPSIVRIALSDDYATVSCWDNGKSWTGPKDIRDRSSEKFDLQNETMNNHGRGEAIMRTIVARISRQRFYNLNQNIFYIPLKPTQEGMGGGIN